VRQRCGSIVVLMALDIGLILQHNTILVTQVIPIGSIGIVGATDVIDITTQHNHHLLLHLLAGDGVASHQIVFVTIHTLHLHGLAIEIVVTTRQAKLIVLGLCVTNLHLAESHICRGTLHNATLLIEKANNQRIAVRLLGTPLRRILHLHSHSDRCCSLRLNESYLALDSGIAYNSVFVAKQLILIELRLDFITLCDLLREIAHINSDICHSIAVLAIKVGGNSHVAQLNRIGCCQRYGTEDTRQTEHILRLQERRIAITIDLDSHHILALDQIFGDVECRQVARVLRESHIAAINPEVEERIHAIEVDINLAVLPCIGNRECTAIRAHLVTVLVGCMVRSWFTHHTTFPIANGNRVFEDNGLVDIDGCAVFLRAIFLQTIDIPVHRHLHVVPRRDIEFGLVKIGRTLLGVLHPIELPSAIKREIVGTILGQHLAGTLL